MQPSHPITPPGSRVWRVVHYPPVTLAIGFLSLFAGGIVVSALLRLAGIVPVRHGPQPPVLAIAQAATIVLVYALFVRDVEKRRNVEFAPAGALRELGAGLVAGLVLFSIIVGVIAALGGYRITGFDPDVRLMPVLLVGIVPGFGEEVIARGLVFRLVEQWLGSWAALAVSAALFGAAHLGNSHATLLAGVAIALEAGIMLAALYMLTRRLWGAIGLHAGWNMTQGGLYGIPVSGGAFHGVLAQTTSGPALLTGGAFGAEASLPAIVVATGFGIALLVACARRGRIVPFLPRRRAGPAVTPL